MRIRLAYLLMFYFIIPFMKGQQLYFFKPDNLKQLPSSEVYNIMQDSRGYIWFGGESGLCRFDGNSLRVFNGKEGLPEGATYDIWEESDGKVWVSTSTNRLLYYDPKDDSLKEARFSKNCVSLLEGQLQQAYQVRTEGENTLWICSQYRSISLDKTTGKAKLEIPDDSTCYNFYWKKSGLIPVKFWGEGMRKRSQKDTIYLRIVKGNDKIRIPLVYKKQGVPKHSMRTVRNGRNECFINVDRFVIRVKPDLTWDVIDAGSSILNIYCDKEDGLWVATYKAGVIYFPENFSKEGSLVSLPGLSVTGVFEDNENGVWCTTLEQGVLYCRNKYLVNYSNIAGLDKKSSLLKGVASKIYISGEKNEVFEMRGNNIIKHPLKNADGRGISDLVSTPTAWYLADKNRVYEIDSNFRILKTINAASELSAHNNRVYGVEYGSLQEITESGTKYLLYPLSSPGNCLLAGSHAGMLLGCRNGVYRIDTLKFTEEKIKGIEGSVTRIIETSNKTVIVTTKQNGIYMLKNKRVENLHTLLNLSTNHFVDVTEDRAGTLWIASNIGLIQVKKPYGLQTVRIFNTFNGLASNEVFKVAVDNDRVYFTTNEGPFSFALRCDLTNLSRPSVYLNKLLVNDTQVNSAAGYFFDHTGNNIRIILDLLTFKKAGHLQRFFYTVEGLDTRVHFENGNEILLSNLNPGHYKVTVYALNNDNMPSKDPLVLNFTIQKAFWQTTYFICAVVLAFAFIIFLLIKLVIARIRRKEAEKTRINKLMAEYQMSALRAQMNPHFIFNCINSIQSYILTNKAEEAYNYLAKFSKLIRMVLNYAEQNLISLAQELEIVELYIELEQVRFENKFSYEIQTDPDIDINEIMVPAMILQPYIENAIWHGLMNLEKGKAGHIKINVKLTGSVLHLIIEDNGVGISKARSLKKSEHKSIANQINFRRAEILNVISNGGRGRVAVEEIKNGDIVAGTRVIIDIPQNNN